MKEPNILKFFSQDYLPRHISEVERVSRACGDLAAYMAYTLPESLELHIGLRKLLEAQDCFIRAAVDKVSG